MSGPVPTFDAAADHYLPADLRVIDLGEDTVQVGTEPGRRVRVTHAPVGTAHLLERFRRPVAPLAVVADLADPDIWLSLLAELTGAGLLEGTTVADPTDRGAEIDAWGLAPRFGPGPARRAALARADGLVVVEGVGRVAAAIGAILADSGIGHLYAPAAAERAASATGRPGWPRAVRTHRPAAQDVPAVVVLVHSGEPDPVRVADLTVRMVPQLSVRIAATSCTVGPLALPGRSVCLTCMRKHRCDIDPHWPLLADALATIPVAVPASLVARTAALVADEVLRYVDGLECTDSVGATLRCTLGTTGPVRATWPQHADCGCRMLAAQHTP